MANEPTNARSRLAELTSGHKPTRPPRCVSVAYWIFRVLPDASREPESEPTPRPASREASSPTGEPCGEASGFWPCGERGWSRARAALLRFLVHAGHNTPTAMRERLVGHHPHASGSARIFLIRADFPMVESDVVLTRRLLMELLATHRLNDSPH